MAGHHRLDAARAHLLERAGRLGDAIDWYDRAHKKTTSTPERNYLLLRAARIRDAQRGAGPI
jgi:predicted RNA polymerase sigma factor